MNNFFSPAPVWLQTGLTIIRLVFGIFLIYHGLEIFSNSKINEYLGWDAFKHSSGQLMVYSGKAAELIAGILLMFGLLTRIACLLTIGVMCYISFFLGKGIIWYDDQHPFLFLLLALVFFFTGPGALALDNLFFKKK